MLFLCLPAICRTEPPRESPAGSTPREAQDSNRRSSDERERPDSGGGHRRRVPKTTGYMPGTAANVDELRMFRWNSRTRTSSVDSGTAHAVPQRLPIPPAHQEEEEDSDSGELPGAAGSLQSTSGRTNSSSLSASSRRLSRRHVSFARGVKDPAELDTHEGEELSRGRGSFREARGPLLPPSASVAAAAAGGAFVGAVAGGPATGAAFGGTPEQSLKGDGVPNGTPDYPNGMPPDDGLSAHAHGPAEPGENGQDEPWGDAESAYNNEELEGLDDEVIRGASSVLIAVEDSPWPPSQEDQASISSDSGCGRGCGCGMGWDSGSDRTSISSFLNKKEMHHVPVSGK